MTIKFVENAQHMGAISLVEGVIGSAYLIVSARNKTWIGNIVVRYANGLADGSDRRAIAMTVGGSGAASVGTHWYDTDNAFVVPVTLEVKVVEE